MKRKKAPGTYTQLPSGTWRWLIWTGKKTLQSDGTTKRERLTGTSSSLVNAQDDAQRALARHGQAGPYAGATVAEWMEVYLEDRSKHLAAHTFRRYRGLTDTWIVPTIGDIPLHKLDVHHVDLMMRSMCKAGTDEPLAKATRRQAREVLAGALREAERRRLVDRNAARLSRAPDGAPAREISTPTPAQVREAIETARTDYGLGPALLIRLAAFTGARRGSLIALRWTDMDPDDGPHGSLTIARSITDLPGIWLEKPTKTGRTARVPLDQQTAAMLAERKAQLSIWGEPTWIISDDGGAPWHPDRATKTWKAIATKLGISGTFHGLRHFTATYLVASGVSDIEAADRLAHADASMIRRVYAASTGDGQDQATKVLADLLNGPIIANASTGS